MINLVLGIFRRMALGGIIVSIATLLPGLLLIFIPLYILLMFFSWLSAKSSTKKINQALGVDIPSNNFFVTLVKGFFIDIASPIGVIIDLFKDLKYKVASFIFTYLILIFNVIIIILIWVARIAIYTN